MEQLTVLNIHFAYRFNLILDQLDKNKLKAMSSQAVGNAVGHNPICIIIPCHRVLGKDGALTGFAGGLEAKKKLLSLEGIAFKE